MKCRFLDAQAFSEAEESRRRLATARGTDIRWLQANNATYGWARLDEVTGVGVMWLMPWYFDPQRADHQPKRAAALKAIADGTFGQGEHNYYLSRHYWMDWSDKRPPICVIGPDGGEWVVDAKSSNGDGWKVTGEPPLLTCRPSIRLSHYHGYLTDGEFGPDVDKR